MYRRGVVLAVVLCTVLGVQGQLKNTPSLELCPSSVTFFPAGSENGNVPSAWTKSAQVTAGNNANDILFPIAFSGQMVPSLQIQPVHFSMNAGSPVPLECYASNSSRRLQQAGQQHVVRAAPSFSIAYQWGNGALITVGKYNKGPVRVHLKEAMFFQSQGQYCLSLFVTLEAQSGSLEDPTNKATLKFPAQAVTLSRKICLNIVSSYPRAVMDVSTCGSKVRVALGGIIPAPVMVPGTSSYLVRPLMTLTGSRNTANGTEQKELLLITAKDLGKTLAVFKTPELDAGTWNLTMTGSWTTDSPSLVNMAGQLSNNTFLSGLVFTTSVVIDGTPAPASALQNVTSTPPTTQGGDLTFQWMVQGMGEVRCMVNGNKVSNAPDGETCMAPLRLPAPSNTSQLSLFFIDSCRDITITTLSYTSTGANLESVAPFLPTVGLNREGKQEKSVAIQKNSAAQPLPVGVMHLFLALLVLVWYL